MKTFSTEDLKKLYKPPKDSHKGDNGKLLIIGGSHLFHGASLWALKVASRIVDMVFYSSVPENFELTKKLKTNIYDFIAVPRDQIDNYIGEADTVLLGPGLPRDDGKLRGEESTRELTKRVLAKHTGKTRWIIDAGSLTEMEPRWLKDLGGNVIVTPHQKEFELLFRNVILRPKAEESQIRSFAFAQDDIQKIAKEYNCIILLKGSTDVICSPTECIEVSGGNAGMTKGGTGDVLAGLVAALACKNNLFLAAASASFINKKAGESLYKKVGPYFNASDLVDEIPRVMKEQIFTR
jgi:NAD(P)H-hydrate epimerase